MSHSTQPEGYHEKVEFAPLMANLILDEAMHIGGLDTDALNGSNQQGLTQLFLTTLRNPPVHREYSHAFVKGTKIDALTTHDNAERLLRQVVVGRSSLVNRYIAVQLIPTRVEALSPGQRKAILAGRSVPTLGKMLQLSQEPDGFYLNEVPLQSAMQPESPHAQLVNQLNTLDALMTDMKRAPIIK